MRRILLTSTPRSGNTWVRRLLADAFELQEYASHTPDDLPWSDLPNNVIIQLHWLPSDGFQRTLIQHQFEILTLARQPLDVLVSIHNFAQTEPQTNCWLQGKGGNEDSIRGVSAESQAFFDYCLSDRAHELLSVSRLWWKKSITKAKLRYEDCVENPKAAILMLANDLNYVVETVAIDQSIERNSIANLRSTSVNNHFWRGLPENWKNILSPRKAKQIAKAHSNSFRTLGYSLPQSNSIHRLIAVTLDELFNRTKLRRSA